MFEVDVDELISWRECDEHDGTKAENTRKEHTEQDLTESAPEAMGTCRVVETDDADVEMCRNVLLRVHLHVFLISSAWRQIVLMQSAQDEDEDEDQKKEEKEGSFCSQKVHWYRSNRLLFEGPVR